MADDLRALSLRLSVEGSERVVLLLEPWGGLYEIGIESEVELTILVPQEAQPPEIVHAPGRIEVWAGSGCTATLVIDGQDTHPGSARTTAP